MTTNMVRLDGWNPRGERLVDHVPMGHWETATFTAGLGQTGIVAPMLIKGAMNGEAFLAYIKHPVPTLKRGDVVVIDNVPCHKVAGVEEIIQAAGTSLRYLPPYSPDFNPDRIGIPSSEDAAAQGCRANIARACAIRSLVHSNAQTFRIYRVLQTCGL